MMTIIRTHRKERELIYMGDWVYILGHILIAVAVFVIAFKSEHPLCWLAFIPIANLWLMIDMADAPIWLLAVAILVWPVAPFVYIWLWMRISENTNKPSWLGLLMIFPFVNVATAMYMAFYEPDEIRA